MFDFVACSSWPSKKSTDLMETHSHAPNHLLSCVPLLHPPLLFSFRCVRSTMWNFFVDDATISAIYSKIIIVCLWKLVFFSANCIHVFKYPALIQIVGKYVYNDTCVSTVCKQSINGDRCVPWTSLLFDRKNLYQSILLTRRLFEGKG